MLYYEAFCTFLNGKVCIYNPASTMYNINISTSKIVLYYKFKLARDTLLTPTCKQAISYTSFVIFFAVSHQPKT